MRAVQQAHFAVRRVKHIRRLSYIPLPWTQPTSQSSPAVPWLSLVTRH